MNVLYIQVFLEGCNRRMCSEHAVLNLIATPLLSKRKGNVDVGMESMQSFIC